MKIALVICILLSLTASYAAAESRTLFQWSSSMGTNPVEWGPTDITFTFEDNQLSLNTHAVQTVGGSSAIRWELMFSGEWAVCGSIVDNQLIRDPYATFIPSDNHNGSVQWAENTPVGYSTHLLLGADFEGCGKRSYTPLYGGIRGAPISGTLVLMEAPAFRADYYYKYWKEAEGFAAYAPSMAVPEASSLALALPGILGLFISKSKKFS